MLLHIELLIQPDGAVDLRKLKYSAGSISGSGGGGGGQYTGQGTLTTGGDGGGVAAVA